MQFFLNLAFKFLSLLVSFLSFSPPAWFADLVAGVVTYGVYAQYFVPVVTFFSSSFVLSIGSSWFNACFCFFTASISSPRHYRRGFFNLA